MPNFVIEYSASLNQQISEDKLMDSVFSGAKNSGHFPPEAIKLRTEKRSGFRLHGNQKDFLHVSAHILSGRTDEQKSEISNAVLAQLKELALNSVFVSVEVVDIHRASFVDFEYE
ncbi:MAG: 5-carboxymethyl-2-hydroxymuconate Delta-isomerase [Paraglaciecola chathamensis]|uniref:5-carboxymethyl-2-hydroxymuconate isomerase n=1 Tax=Paraglaciecola agarilytica NO2 TaxID=1125747 RepID=A0ABQ0I413_9ALTE|nr:5-carboxymethyl-2-hydroxymuconate Delta-isomerase [Paraglaciecola agarilytica]AEE22609.1 putative 5-carboxymethyl-2-hydroxymuconate delta isomerase [Glaciecola sp. 4H-3-7+YE-5]GAC04073.1 5-carboxymethyl-2-hydroxymuconate isomerase [Paraglaciecola agarilytica NO2]